MTKDKSPDKVRQVKRGETRIMKKREEWADPTLLSEVRKYGKFDDNACLNCGGCTIVCSLTAKEMTFSPRRVLQYVRIGLKGKLRSSLDPWLCYYCGECSTSCPRQTETGESMMTVRRYLISQYDWTGLSSKIQTSKVWYIGSLLFVSLFVFLLFIFYHIKIVGLEFPSFLSSAMPLEHMFGRIITFTLWVSLLPLFFLLTNTFRMWYSTMLKDSEVKIPFYLYIFEMKSLLLHFFTQKRFRDCVSLKNRWFKHFLLFSGCFVMFILVVLFLRWFQTDNIYPFYHPQRWFGYLATLALFLGSGEILIGRIRKKEEIHKFSEPLDIVFPLLIFLTALSGILLHIFRYAGKEFLAHYTYLAHLMIAVPMILIEIPFGKWAHFIYRPLAMYFQAVKEGVASEGK